MSRENFLDLLQTIEGTYIVPYELLNATNCEAAHAEFLANSKLELPPYTYENYQEKLLHNSRTTAKVQDNLAHANLSSTERQLIEIYANYNHTANKFVMLNAGCRNCTIIPTALRAAYNDANYWLYGRVDRTIAGALLNTELSDINPSYLSADERVHYDQIVERTAGLRNSEPLYQPSKAIVERFGKICQRLLKPYLDLIPPSQTEFTPAEVCNLLQQYCDLLGCRYQPIVDENSNFLSVSQQEGIIKVPAHPSKPTYSRQDVIAKITGHEFGVHTLRGASGEGQQVTGFAIGIPGYEEFEEGLAVCVEESLGGESNTRSSSYYVNIALVTYCDFTFRELFETRKWLDYLKKVSKPLASGTQGSIMGECERTAFSQARRATRGTGILPNNKDLMYYAMRQKIWEFITEHLDDEEELIKLLFQSGKTNPLLESHQAIIEGFHRGDFA